MYFPNDDVQRKISKSKSENVVGHEDGKGLTRWRLHTIEIQSKGYIDSSSFKPDMIEDLYTYKTGWRYSHDHIERDFEKRWDYRREGLAVLYGDLYEVHLFETVTETVVENERIAEFLDQGDGAITYCKSEERKKIDYFPGGGDCCLIEEDKVFETTTDIPCHTNKSISNHENNVNIYADDDDASPYIRLCCHE